MKTLLQRCPFSPTPISYGFQSALVALDKRGIPGFMDEHRSESRTHRNRCAADQRGRIFPSRKFVVDNPSGGGNCGTASRARSATMYSTVVSRPASAAIAPGARARPNRRASAPRSAVAASRPLAATSLVPASRSTAIRRSEALQATLPARASVVARAASSAAPAPAAGEDTGETTAMINTVKVRARARRLSRGNQRNEPIESIPRVESRPDR